MGPHIHEYWQAFLSGQAQKKAIRNFCIQGSYDIFSNMFHGID